MKYTKNLFALLLTLVLALSLALPALAQEPSLALPVIAGQPQSVHLTQSGRFTLRVEAHIPTGDLIGYRWYRAEAGGEDTFCGYDAEYSGYIGRAETQTYYVEVYNRGNPTFMVTSDTVQVTLEPPADAYPVITAQPQPVTIRVDSDFKLSVEAHIPNGDEITYIWRRHEGGTTYYFGSSTTEITLNLAQAGTYEYSVTLRNSNESACHVESERALVEVTPPNPPTDPDPALMPVITVQPQSARIKKDETYSMNVQAHIPGGDPVGYIWYRDNIRILPRGQSIENFTAKANCEIYVEVYNLNHPEYRVRSETAHVELYSDPLTTWEKIQGFFMLIGSGIAGFSFISLLLGPFFFVGFLMLPFYPIQWLISLFL